MSAPIFFVNIAYMTRYQGTRHDKPRYGGSYIRRHGTGGEVYNFLKKSGSYYGFIPPDGGVNIDRLGATPENESIKGIAIIWVAKSVRGSVIVGWYKNAEIFRHPRPSGKRKYSAIAKAKYCSLLPTRERIFRIPRGRGGMGEANKWYADRPKHESFKQQVWEYMRSGRVPGPRPSSSAQDTRAWQRNQKKRARIEENAMATTENWYQKQRYSTHRVDREKLGWDLEAWNKEEHFKIEVKGLSGSFVGVELTPNEYEKMRKHKKTFHISVVPKALSSKPGPRVFIYSPSKKAWQDDDGQLVIRKRIGARLSEKTLG